MFGLGKIGEIEKVPVSRTIEGEEIVIGVIADTHISGTRVQNEVLDLFEQREVDLIIHAGDLVVLDVLDDLEKIAPVVAVAGNMDGPAVRAKLPRITAIQVNKFKLGVIHDTINPFSDKLKRMAVVNGWDVVIFGHTHRPELRNEKGIWFMNPGSPSKPILAKPSVGIITITDEIKPEIVHLAQ
jgi:hypothetical protein